jgi:Fur family ferric uptake transcriptional regulator
MQRETQQRRAIRRAFEAAGRPLSPQEIHEGARSNVRGLGIATVYRNIKAMLEEGWLRSVELPGAPSRYELAGKDHHHHFHCRECDRVFEMEQCPGSLRDLAPQGFEPESHEIILYGLCATCSGSAKG